MLSIDDNIDVLVISVMNTTLFYVKAFLVSSIISDRVSLNCKNVYFLCKYNETEVCTFLVKCTGKNNSMLSFILYDQESFCENTVFIFWINLNQLSVVVK